MPRDIEVGELDDLAAASGLFAQEAQAVLLPTCGLTHYGNVSSV
jgi:hypothetical protein